MTTEKNQRFDFMNPDVPAGLPHFEMPLIRTTAENFAPCGTIVTDFMNHLVPITRWPHTGWRPVDAGTGDEGGYMDGIFEFWWEGDVLFGENKAVNDKQGTVHARVGADFPSEFGVLLSIPLELSKIQDV